MDVRQNNESCKQNIPNTKKSHLYRIVLNEQIQTPSETFYFI